MKKRGIISFFIIILTLIGGYFLLCMRKTEANNDLSMYNLNLSKYEVVFVYPKNNENSLKVKIDNVKNELKKIYNSDRDKLIVSEMTYENKDCKRSIIADIKLHGDISYKSLVFFYTNSNMCDSIEFAIDNSTSGIARHMDGFARQKIITIPVDNEAKQSLSKWKKGTENWLNYNYSNTTEEAIKQMYKTFNLTEEQVNKSMNSDIYIEDIPKENKKDNNDNIKSVISDYRDSELKITHKVKNVQIVLSNGMTINPDITKINQAKTIHLDKSNIYGAKVYVEYSISAENVEESGNVEIGSINIKCNKDDLKYDSKVRTIDGSTTNEKQGWVENEDGSLTNILKAGETKRLVKIQTLNTKTNLVYENKINAVSYTKKVIEIDENNKINEKIEKKYINSIIKSEQIKIEY